MFVPGEYLIFIMRGGAEVVKQSDWIIYWKFQGKTSVLSRTLKFAIIFLYFLEKPLQSSIGKLDCPNSSIHFELPCLEGQTGLLRLLVSDSW